MGDNVLDLDILRPKAVVVKLAGKKIDISFVPVGITFEVDAIVQEMAKMKEGDLMKGGASAKRSIDLMISLCSLFCSVKNPELDEAWFRANATPEQLAQLVDVIKNALTSSYEGIEAYRKN